MTVRDLLVLRAGRVSLPRGTGGTSEADLVHAAELELAKLGFVASYRLRGALAALDRASLARELGWLIGVLAASLGADQKHEPLFRRFPEGVPRDTHALWVEKVLAFYFQRPDLPCLSCGSVGSTHVLNPCQDVVCERCFDGANYSRCPVCERVVDRSSPFFGPDPSPRVQKASAEASFKLLDLAADPEEEARGLYVSLCARAQAMSKDDVAALLTLVSELGERVIAWTPERIPVRENRAHVFGTLLRQLPLERALAAARPHLGTATDLLRVIAVWSGADPGLQKRQVLAKGRDEERARWSERTWQAHLQMREVYRRYSLTYEAPILIQSPRFPVGRMSRPLRRGLLELLEGLDEDALVEDMLRHRSAWLKVGERLHPGEQAARFPRVARAFAVLRGSTGPAVGPLVEAVRSNPHYERGRGGRLRFVGFNARSERLIAARDPAALVEHLAARPGELARRLDLALRLDPARAPEVAARFQGALERVSFPTLLTLATLLPRRDAPWPARVYFPKGAEFLAPSAPDRRPPLGHALTGPLVAAIERELLGRLAEKPRFPLAILDAGLAGLAVPMNERTASRGAVALPRGSSLAVPRAKLTRLFLHWCEPAGGHATDIDLSVAFYDADWRYVDTCSYYQLETRREGRVLARSAGDSRNAPPPDGASEFVDVYREEALAAGVRWAVMVVNAYAGMPFSALERAFAGVMVRDDAEGLIFDPRAVKLRFELSGENGVFVPLLLDLEQSRLFWLDAYSEGQLAFNNVATSTRDIQRIGPAALAYWGHGVRPTLFQLAALHAAARADRVLVRDGDGLLLHERRERECDHTFYQRLLRADADQLLDEAPALEEPVFAALFAGDLPLPEGSQAYALFREGLTGTIAASDLLG